MGLPFNFLISTSKHILLYEKNNVRSLHTGSGVYFGIAKGHGLYFIIGRNNFDGTGGGFTDSLNSLVIIDSTFTVKGEIPIGFVKDGHQLLFKDDSLYICNTGYDIITKLTADNQMSHITFSDSYGKDICHYNSINFYENKWYVTQHRTEFGKDDGGISIYDNEWKRLDYIEIGKHIHNCVVDGDYLFATDSYNGQLVKINLKDKNDKVIYPILKGYLSRGIIIKDGYLLCGLSEFDVREKRHLEKNGRISVFKYPEIEFLDQIIIEGIGQVNDMLLI